MSYKTVPVTASLHPHDHRAKDHGPWSLRIAPKSQPNAVEEWDKYKVLLCMEQPPGDIILIWVLYLRSGRRKPDLIRGCQFHHARHYVRSDGTKEVRVKSRYGSSFPRPVPIGVYSGTCMYDPDGGMAVYTFQARTLTKEPEESKPKVILTPGDEEFHGTLKEAARTLEGTHGLGRGTDEAGGVHHL